MSNLVNNNKPPLNLSVRRFVAPALAAVLAVAVGWGIYQSSRPEAPPALPLPASCGSQAAAPGDAAKAAQGTAPAAVIEAVGVVGSEKGAFFADPRVKAALRAQGLCVRVVEKGSRDIAGQYDPARFDFGFPSGAPAAERLTKLAKPAAVYAVFHTPMVLASWRPIADILVANGVASQAGGVYTVNTQRLIELMGQRPRWSELKGNAAFSNSKRVLVASTDAGTSNSGAMYLALASYVLNGEQVVQSQAELDKVMPVAAPLFLEQGFQETSSAAAFDDFVGAGMGKTPMLMAYESQLIEYWLKQPERLKEQPERVILYPQPTVYSKHVLVPFTPKGERLGALLKADPTLRALAHEYGYRTGDDSQGPALWKQRGITVPATLQDVVNPPTQDWLERMIAAIQTIKQGPP